VSHILMLCMEAQIAEGGRRIFTCEQETPLMVDESGILWSLGLGAMRHDNERTTECRPDQRDHQGCNIFCKVKRVIEELVEVV